jgi:hypothetical protein
MNKHSKRTSELLEEFNRLVLELEEAYSTFIESGLTQSRSDLKSIDVKSSLKEK